MTITSTRYVEPLQDVTNGRRSPKPSPRVWHAIDPPFKGYQEAPSEAFQQSHGDTAIVIDNGVYTWLVAVGPRQLTRHKAQVLFGLAGPLTQPLDYHFLPMLPDTETGNSTERSLMLAMMHTRTLLQEVRSGMPSNPGPVLWAIGM